MCPTVPGLRMKFFLLCAFYYCCLLLLFLLVRRIYHPPDDRIVCFDLIPSNTMSPVVTNLLCLKPFFLGFLDNIRGIMPSVCKPKVNNLLYSLSLFKYFINPLFLHHSKKSWIRSRLSCRILAYLWHHIGGSYRVRFNPLTS